MALTSDSPPSCRTAWWINGSNAAPRLCTLLSASQLHHGCWLSHNCCAGCLNLHSCMLYGCSFGCLAALHLCVRCMSAMVAGERPHSDGPRERHRVCQVRTPPVPADHQQVWPKASGTHRRGFSCTTLSSVVSLFDAACSVRSVLRKFDHFVCMQSSFTSLLLLV